MSDSKISIPLSPNHQTLDFFIGFDSIIVLRQVAQVQSDIKAAQSVLADVRKIFSERAQAKKAARAANPKATAKRVAKAKAAP